MRTDSLRDLRNKRANQVALMDVDVWDDNISRAWFTNVNVNSGACCQGRKVQVRIGLRPDVMVSEDGTRSS